MNNKVKIKVKTNSYSFINYLVSHSIKYDCLVKNNDNYDLIVDYEDYKKINRRYNTIIIKYYGLKYYKNIFFIHKYLIISFLISLFFLKLLCNTIFYIKINVDTDSIKSEVENVLKRYDISIYKRKKSFKELAIIKEKILEEMSNIEWIEINESGCKYIINLTEKVSSESIENNSVCDVIANKSGVIKHIVTYNGTKLKEENEYVNKGEVLISGTTYKDENIIDEVCANGEVYAEVWYTAKINIPLKYEEKIETGKVINHYYLDIFDHKFTLIGKYNIDNVYNSVECILDKPYLPFKLYREKKIEYENKIINLTYDDALKKALENTDKYFNNLLKEGEYIISKKVLKKEVNSSKIYVEVFFKVYENIGVEKELNND